MGYSGSSSFPFVYAFIIQMLSSVNISSVWLHTERWIYLYSVWGHVLERCQGFASASVTQVTGRASPPSTCTLSLYLAAFPVSGETPLGFTGVASRTEKMIQGVIWLFLLSPDGRRCSQQWERDALNVQKPSQISFSRGESFFLCVVNLLLHQKGWRPSKGKQRARLTLCAEEKVM